MKQLFTLIGTFCIFSIHLFAQWGIGISGSSHLIITPDTYLGMEGYLKVSNAEGLIINPEAAVTTKGDLELDGARRAIVVQTSTASGSPRGSYIVKGDVNPSGKGSMEVQSYITGLPGDDTVSYMHFVGAPVEDTTSGYNHSVRLQQFDMTYLDTYAYYWDSDISDIDINNPNTPWVNIWPYDYEVPLGVGLTLTNGVAGSDVMIMEGYPIGNESITFTTSYNTTNHYELISNPFPSAIDFSQFYTDNSTYIMNKYWVWVASGDNAGNYYPNSNGTGGSQYIQLGQAFFVEMENNQSGDISFTNFHKTHSNVAFRETTLNELAVHVSGGSLGFGDNIWIRFMEGASAGYDDFDAIKWNSINSQATMIRSIAEDGTELAIDMLPEDYIYNRGTTVPVHFECGEDAEYTFTFSGIETFEKNTEIWLEDLLTDEWHSVTTINSQYTYHAAPEDPKHRFNVHFFGPTGIPETDVKPTNTPIKIYASKQFAYILNNTNEIIEDVIIYNLMGQLIYRDNLPQLTLNKVFVSNTTGYYVVRVQTNRNIYIEKVFITQ